MKLNKKSILVGLGGMAMTLFTACNFSSGATFNNKNEGSFLNHKER